MKFLQQEIIGFLKNRLLGIKNNENRVISFRKKVKPKKYKIFAIFVCDHTVLCSASMEFDIIGDIKIFDTDRLSNWTDN